MINEIKLSELMSDIDDVLNIRFGGKTFWVKAEITDVKKQPDKRWCFLKFIEKEGAYTTAEIRGVFWNNSYAEVEKFEKLSGKTFMNGLELTCLVRVRFNKRYGIDLEVLEIDQTFVMGQEELIRQQTLDRLLAENPNNIRLKDGLYYTRNQSLKLPPVLQRIALITASNSDGQRDFNQEILHNRYGYAIAITEYLTVIQGNTASAGIIEQLTMIEAKKAQYDAVAIVRGGGSVTDFKPFEDYELCKMVAAFPLPIFTGIGHDRNTSIVDMMARQLKTPTKVASSIVEHNFNFEQGILSLKERIQNAAQNQLYTAQRNLSHLNRTLNAYSPANILAKGYAIVMQGDKIIVNPKSLKTNTEITTILKNESITSTITHKAKHDTTNL